MAIQDDYTGPISTQAFMRGFLKTQTSIADDFEPVRRESFFRQILKRDSQAPYTFESFQQLELVGEGTYGKVFKAKLHDSANSSSFAP